MSGTEKITSRDRLGFIGLGFLGSRIARRMLTAGFPLVAYDIDDARVAELAQRGADSGWTPDRLARNADVVISCLPTDLAVEAVYLGAGGIFRSARPGTRIIEMSTIPADTSRRLHRLAQQSGLAMLDVAVSGSTSAAEAGALTLFGGGERQVFESAESIFSAIAGQWFYIGPGGSGVAMKLVVNTLLGVGMQAIAEAVTLGEKLDLPRNLVFDVLARTAVVAPAHVGKLASARVNDYSPQFPIRLMRKDFGLILAEAANRQIAMPVTEAAAAVNDIEASTGSEEDFSAVIRRMEFITKREMTQ